jgi:SAM-dependent methyltransferase
LKSADDPTTGYKALVQRGYDRCAATYDQARQRGESPELALLTERLSAGATVLDVGCGAGVPIARTLARRFKVTGVDISGGMIARARANVPQATFIHADVMAVTFPPEHFDAVVAFYSIFHLPREEHPELLRRIHRWLRPGGYLLATLSAVDEAPYTDGDFFGETMFWSNYGLEAYEEILAGLGFSLLEMTGIGHGYGETYAGADEQHPLILARKG